MNFSINMELGDPMSSATLKQARHIKFYSSEKKEENIVVRVFLLRGSLMFRWKFTRANTILVAVYNNRKSIASCKRKVLILRKFQRKKGLSQSQGFSKEADKF